MSTSLDALLGNVWANGSPIELGGGLNFIGFTVAYNPTTLRIDITSSGGGGGSAHTIQNNGVSITQRTVLNFVGFAVADVGGKSTVTLPAINLATGVTGLLPTANVADDSITYQKQQNVSAASRLIGRGSAAGAGDPQEIDLGASMALSGTQLQRAALTGVISAAANSNTTAFASGDFAAIPLQLGTGTRSSLGDIRASNAFSLYGRNSFGSLDTALLNWNGAVPELQIGVNGGGLTGYAKYLAGSVQVGVGTNIIHSTTPSAFNMLVNTLQWDAGVPTAPVITQAINTGGSATGRKLTLSAQSCTGATSVGGDLDCYPGAGTSAGGLARLMSGGTTPGGGSARLSWNNTGISFFGATCVAQQTVTGSRGGNVALGNLITALANMGLIVDSSTA
jgi:uncharacterized protein DUF5907